MKTPATRAVALGLGIAGFLGWLHVLGVGLPLLIALAMIIVMLVRPRGLWPSPEHGKAAPAPLPAK